MTTVKIKVKIIDEGCYRYGTMLRREKSRKNFCNRNYTNCEI